MRVLSALVGGVLGVAGLGLVGCGDEQVLLPHVTPPETPGDPCVAFAPDITPITGEGPLHRMTPLTARWAGGREVPAAFTVTVDGAAVAGTSWVRSGYALFVPERPYPENARVDWRFAACDVEKTGAFTTGALFSPIDIEEVQGRSFGFDLRSVAWEQPEASSTVNGFVLRWHLAPTLVVDVVDVTLGKAVLALSPGVLDDNGAVVRDLARGIVEVEASLLQNPYLRVTAPELELMALDGPVTLRGLELVLGLEEGCFADGRLIALMDVRELEKQGKEPCARLLSLTGESCVPCEDDLDTDLGCFFLSMEGVSSVSEAESVLKPRPLP